MDTKVPEGELNDVTPDNEEVIEEEHTQIEGDEPEIEEEAPAEEAPAEPTIELSKFSETKEILSRVLDQIGGEEALLEMAETDPKLAERLKGQFSKKYGDVKLSKEITPDDLEATVDALVEKRLAQVNKASQLDSFIEKTGMTPIEFSDIKEEVVSKAKKLVDTEIASDFDSALMTAFKMVNPQAAQDMTQKQTLRKAKQITATKPVAKQESNEMGDLEQRYMNNLPRGFKI